ncbi:MAG: asparagine--tRNA ligase [Thermoplasmatales archaeon]|nr:asparagine--tRNA ligase [Thermoplasmatales archaeon]
MKFDKIKDALEKNEGEEASLRGWIYRKRSSGKIIFLIIRDTTGIMQVIIEKEKIGEEDFKKAEKALIESSIEVEGVIHLDERAPGGKEIHAKKVRIKGFAEEFPITEYQSVEFLMDKRHLWIRSRKLTEVMKLKAKILKFIRQWFDENDFYEVTPSVITLNAAEGGATVFSIDYFGEPAYLSQTAQMYLEALIFSLERVWSLTPSFRAEKSKTRKHLIEFWHLEAEEAWVNNEENMRLQEDLISYVCQRVAKECKNELDFLGRNAEDLKKVEPPFRRIKYEEAIRILQDKGFDIKWGDDFGAVHERAIVEGEEKPIFIKNFPVEAKAFYMKISPDKKTVECADMLAPEGYGEIIGGSEREENIESMIERLKKDGAKIENYEWYFDLRRYGSVPHSGFGLGMERLVCWIAKLEHIRDATPFPRLLGRAYP